MRRMMCIAFFAYSAVPLLAADAPPLRAHVGATLIHASGNTSALSIGARGAIQYNAAPFKFAADGDYLRVDGDQSTKNQKARATLQIERTFGKLLAAHLEGAHKHDKQSGLFRQESIECGVALNFIDKEDRWMKASFSIAGTDEDQLGRSRNEGRFAGSNVRVKDRWPIAKIVSIEHSIFALLSFRSSNDWRLENATALHVSMSRLLALQVSHQLEYRNAPAVGKRRADGTSLVSLVASWPRRAKQ